MFFRRKDPKKELSSLLEGYELPSFSPVVMKALTLLRDPNSALNDIAKEIAYDPALVVAIFKMVNSAAFGLSRRVESINQAAALLGRGRLESIILAQAIKDSMPTINTPWFDINTFWKISAKRATLARHIANKLHPQTATESFTAGMLQDIGMPLLAYAKSSKYEKVIDQWRSGKELLLPEIEQKHISFDHQQVGSLMGFEWNLPETLVEAISGHHIVEGTAPAVNLASLLAPDKNDKFDKSVDQIVFTCINNFSLNETTVITIIDMAFEEADTIQL